MYYIYKMTSPSGKSYVGQTKQNPDVRLKQHWDGYIRWANDGRPRKSYLTKLYYAFDKYHKDLWSFNIIAETDDVSLVDKLEIEMIAKYDCVANGYNLQHGGFGWHGIELSDDHRNNLSESRKEWFNSDDGMAWRKQLSENFKNNNPSKLGHPGYNSGNKHSEATREKISIANKGKRLGVTLSEETRRKISETKRAHPHQFTDEQRARISARFKGGRLSDEHKAKIGMKHKGKVVSDETRALISEAAKKRTYVDVTCPHCGLIGHGGTMKRWHFDNCKDKK